MRAAALSLLRVLTAVAVLALAGVRAGIPAVLVTDTADLRNPNYHTRNDTAATLDYVRMARVVDGVYTAVTHTSH